MPSHVPAAIRVALIGDYLLVREGVARLLADEADMTVVGQSPAGADGDKLVRAEQPDIAIVDLVPGAEAAFETLAAITAMPVHPRVLVLAGARDLPAHLRAVRSGASGIVLKDQGRDALTKAIRRVHAGEMWIDRGMTALLLRDLKTPARRAADDGPAPASSLTAREREIVRLVAAGCSTRKIAASLTITEKTVRNHLASIYDKLAVSHRLELALYAVKHGLATPHAQD
jgi:DNA-binding NarL/FixJ family response regulator